MNKVTKAGMVVIATATLAACGSTTAAPQVTKTVTVVETQAPPVDDTVNSPIMSDAEMLRTVRELSPDFNTVSDADILETIGLICSALSEGHAGSEIVGLAAGNIGYDNATTLIAAAAAVKCPEYADLAVQ